MDYPDINIFIDALLTGTKAHICFHDLSGLTDMPLLKVHSKYAIHSRPFCDSAKKTKKGMELCLRCKGLTIEKAIREQKPFLGYCPFGICELVFPLTIRGETAAVLYLGNLLEDTKIFEKKLKRAAQLTGADANTLFEKTKTLEQVSDCTPYKNMLWALEAYTRMLYEKQPLYDKKETLHWTIRQFISHIHNYYSGNLTLCALARLYHINEQYAGRLFKAQTGQTFHEYLNTVRLTYCAQWLADTNITVAEAAYNAGYNNVTYFNRMFLKQYGQTPTAYRNEKKTAKETERMEGSYKKEKGEGG